MKQVHLKPLMTHDQAGEKWGKKLLGKTDFSVLMEEDCDVFCADTGEVIAKFRKNIIPAKIQKAAFVNLYEAATPTDNRQMGSGLSRRDRKQNRGKNVNSGLVGFFDRMTRQPFCRLTAFNQKHFDKFKKAYPIIKFVDAKYEELMPDHYGLQRELADKSSKDFVIKDTAFTTVTVNRDWQTAVHTDQGDFAEGFGNLVALRTGQYEGGFFVVVKWGVAFDLQNGDLLLVDVHQWHGNTPIEKKSKDACRLSLVMYYRDRIRYCGTAQQEYDFTSSRLEGEALYRHNLNPNIDA